MVSFAEFPLSTKWEGKLQVMFREAVRLAGMSEKGGNRALRNSRPIKKAQSSRQFCPT
jgi:hypothetical protein